MTGYLDACMSIGPWGGPENQGSPWSYKGQDYPITEIIMRHADFIDSIVFQNKTSDGIVKFSDRFGGPGGNITSKVTISSGEFITGVRLSLGSYGGQSVISLSILTNVTIYGPFGRDSGTNILVPITDGRVVGFFGRAGQYLNAIGIYAVAKAKSSDFVQEYKAVNTVMKIMGPRDAGPWGPLIGKAWDDGVYAGVDHVFMEIGYYKGSEEKFQILQSVQFRYKKKNGDLVMSSIYGEVQGSGATLDRCNGAFHILCDRCDGVWRIDCSTDELIGIEGYYGSLDGVLRDRIISLKFYTKERMYGPYGAEIGTSFSSPPSSGKVVGFFGRSGRHLTSIGLHIDYN